ncbi:MAG: holo-ACP synthase [Solirubrobacteraceae bacterium]|jgi:holo-[acyl-carrier protein] synthase
MIVLAPPNTPELPVGFAVGLDLASIEDVQWSINAHADRYLRRVYTNRELDDCRNPDGTPNARRLAARFAAKESTMKALRLADEALPWRSIGVRSDGFGRPSIELSGRAEELASRRGVSALDVSLTHEGPFAAAVVVAQFGGPR